ncbi:hypothetical protein QQZ08_009297 [Neonectria magnoliae]|uniref:N-acetyltransferase domain-containing protein n=1 Tax=Neonectria magnoliae TaxID=2732573 RepID=A0ABR1HPR3_9HYPO
MAFIRPYEQRDFHATAHICRETLPPSLSASPDAWRLAPYLWTHQYTHLSPTTCFVLDDGSGLAVGYCIGCPDTAAFIAAYPSYVAAVLDPSLDLRPDPLAPPEPWVAADGSVNAACLAQMAYDPRRLLPDGAHTARFRATLHIDLLPEWQARGWGGRLLERVVQALAEQGGGSGVWVGVAEDNAKVVPFYLRMGFRLWDEGDDGDEAEDCGAEEGKPKRRVQGGGGIVLVREFPGTATGTAGSVE